MTGHETRKLVRKLRGLGCTVDVTRGHHWRVFGPNGEGPVILSATPSDPRAVRNMHADLQRVLGLTLT